MVSCCILPVSDKFDRTILYYFILHSLLDCGVSCNLTWFALSSFLCLLINVAFANAEPMESVAGSGFSFGKSGNYNKD